MSHYFWDWLILNLLVGQAVLYYLVTRTGVIRNFVLKTVAATLLFSGISVIFYGSFIEPNFIVIKHETVDLRREAMADGNLKPGSSPSSETTHVRIALMSDFHLGPYHGRWFVEQVIRKIEREKPDIVVIDGDSVYYSRSSAKALALFKDLEMVKLATLGNHEYNLETKGDVKNMDDAGAADVERTLWAAGVKVLKNKYIHYQDKLWILGVDDYWTGRADVDTMLKEINNDKPKILLVHNPDGVKLLRNEPIDLVLSGHTHGGQIRLPWIGPIGRIPDELGQKFDKGFFDIPGSDGQRKYKTFITSGLGTSGPRARLFNPPEIVIFDLTL